MTTKQLDLCRSLPSFRRYVEFDIKRNADLLINDSKFKEFLEECLQNIDLQTQRVNVIAQFLFELGKELPGAPLGKQVEYLIYHSI